MLTVVVVALAGAVTSACETNDRATVVNNTDQRIVVGSYGATGKRFTAARIGPHGIGVISVGPDECDDTRYDATDPAGIVIKAFTHVCIGDEITIP